MIPEKQAPPSSVALQCPQCRKIGNCNTRGSYLFLSRIIEDEEPIQVVLLECPRCHYPLLIERYWDEATEAFTGHNFMFPRRRSATGYAPAAVNESYSEAIKCRDAHAYTASVVMCRRALEAIALDKKAAGRSLYERVANMRRTGEISNEIFEWFTLLRELGNQAAHEISMKHTERDADDTIDFTLAIMEFVYTYRERFRQFKDRTAGQTSGAGQ